MVELPTKRCLLPIVDLGSTENAAVLRMVANGFHEKAAVAFHHLRAAQHTIGGKRCLGIKKFGVNGFGTDGFASQRTLINFQTIG